MMKSLFRAIDLNPTGVLPSFRGATVLVLFMSCPSILYGSAVVIDNSISPGPKLKQSMDAPTLLKLSITYYAL